MNSLIAKLVITALLSCLLTGSAVWLSLGSKLVTRDEVQQMIRDKYDPLTPDLRELRDQVEELKIEQAKMNAKLDLVLKVK